MKIKQVPRNAKELAEEMQRRAHKKGVISFPDKLFDLVLEKVFYCDETTGCLFWRECNPNTGAGIIQKPQRHDPFFLERPQSQIVASRWVWQIINQIVLPDKMVVRHSCNNPACVQPLHLTAGTHYENRRDRSLTEAGVILLPQRNVIAF